MIKNLKLFIRNKIEKKLEASYLCKLDEKTKTYDAWVKDRERKEEFSLAGRSNQEENTDYFIFVEDKENIAPGAKKELEKIFKENPLAAVVYGDEDEVNSTKTHRMNPWYKPDYSPDTLFSFFYFGSLVAIRKDKVPAGLEKYIMPNNEIIEIHKVGREFFYEEILGLCYSLKKENIIHSKKILYTSSAITYWGFEESYKDMKVRIYGLRKRENHEGVSIIIPSKDNPFVLERCLNSIKELTKNVPYEIILVDNGSGEENKEKILKMQEKYDFAYLYQPMEFNFSQMCNMGAAKAKYPFLLFLNDDCEVRDGNWLENLVYLAAVKETGAVGTKLYYPDSKIIQHCGIYNIHMGPAHKLQFKEDTAVFYDRRNYDIRNVSAVTAACLMVKKEVFLEVKGFDEKMKVAFNDVDLCYRIHEAGYYNVVDNTTVLWHHESLSRGSDDSEEKQLRFRGEKIRLYQKHPKLWSEDPYYHPNFTKDILDTSYSLAYEYDEEQFVVKKPQRIRQLPKKLREDSCVAPLIEYGGNLEEWFLNQKKVEELQEKLGFKEGAYLQGSVVVIGSDNACFDKFMILCHEESKLYYQVMLPVCYRPDIDKNLPDQKNVALAGFCCFLDLRDLQPGRYEISIMVKDKISGQYILRKTERWIERNTF